LGEILTYLADYRNRQIFKERGVFPKPTMRKIIPKKTLHKTLSADQAIVISGTPDSQA
jgi:hypothetical protein